MFKFESSITFYGGLAKQKIQLKKQKNKLANMRTPPGPCPNKTHIQFERRKPLGKGQLKT